MGRRFEKKVTTDGAVTLHERYLYRDYLQIAALDLLANTTKHAILWDPTQPTATRPLAIQQGKKWHTYAWDLTKNITALFTPTGNLSTTYTYTLFGKVSVAGEVEQAIQWSSEMHDIELALVYYNYRYYNPSNGRWTRRDPIGIKGGVNLYGYVNNYIFSRDKGGYFAMNMLEIKDDAEYLISIIWNMELENDALEDAYFVQEINCIIQRVSCSDPFDNEYKPEHYWEAWPINKRNNLSSLLLPADTNEMKDKIAND